MAKRYPSARPAVNIVALDARTGEEKWRKSRNEVSTWGTPVIVEAAGPAQVIASGSNRVRSYDLATGELIWECGGLGSNLIASPLTFDNLAIRRRLWATI